MIDLARLKKQFRSWLGDWLAHRGFLKERLIVRYVNQYEPPTYHYTITQDSACEQLVTGLFEKLREFRLHDRVPRPSTRVAKYVLEWPALTVYVNLMSYKFTYEYDYSEWGSTVQGGSTEDLDLALLPNAVKDHGQFNPENLENWEQNQVPEMEVRTIGLAPRHGLYTSLPEVMGVSQGKGGTYLHCARWPGEASWEKILQSSPRVIKPVKPDPGEIPWGKILLEW